MFGVTRFWRAPLPHTTDFADTCLLLLFWCRAFSVFCVTPFSVLVCRLFPFWCVAFFRFAWPLTVFCSADPKKRVSGTKKTDSGQAERKKATHQNGKRQHTKTGKPVARQSHRPRRSYLGPRSMLNGLQRPPVVSSRPPRCGFCAATPSWNSTRAASWKIPAASAGGWPCGIACSQHPLLFSWG